MSVTYSQASVRGHDAARLATALLIIYVIGKVFSDNGDVGISFIAPPYGSQIGFSAHTVSHVIAFVLFAYLHLSSFIEVCYIHRMKVIIFLYI